jgi:hypothetical protein
MNDNSTQEFRLDIFKLLRDELSVSVYAVHDESADPHAATLTGEVLTQALREHFGFDDRRLSELGMEIASQGRTAITLHCSPSQLRAAQLMPPE